MLHVLNALRGLSKLGWAEREVGLISIDDIRALEMYELALSLVEAKGAQAPASTLMEYRAGNLTIHYLTKTGHLEVWYLRKVLVINRVRGTLKVIHYAPGEWQDELKAANLRSEL